jgi:hypothetical protein
VSDHIKTPERALEQLRAPRRSLTEGLADGYKEGRQKTISIFSSDAASDRSDARGHRG